MLLTWIEIVFQLKSAFSREKTFFWAVISLLSFSFRQDRMGGISSLIRSFHVNPKYYQRLLDFFQSEAVKLDILRKLWVQKEYGEKVLLKDYFSDETAFQGINSPVYGEKTEKVLVRTLKLLKRGFGEVLFVLRRKYSGHIVYVLKLKLVSNLLFIH